jgi:hypothetical protein
LALHTSTVLVHTVTVSSASREPHIVLGMLPEAPDLAALSGRWRDRELFWIVKHGIKYTGMPSWPSLQRYDQWFNRVI